MSSSRVGPRWHDERRRKLLADHPEVRKLVGHNTWSAVAVFTLVAAQFGMAIAVKDLPWWGVLMLSYAIGAFVAHAIGILIHDAAHDLIFKSGTANRLLAIFANLPLLFPAAMDFREKHLKHHAHVGEPDGLDTQAPQTWDFKFVTNGWKRAIWHMAGPILTHSDAPTHRPSKWVSLNVAANLMVSVGFFLLFGFKATLFLGFAGLMAFGHHPVGVRRYGEHLTLRQGQPTTSYYGPFNRVAFDVGYHVEHHDLPSVPWNRLRALHATAPELYAPLASVKSWLGLLYDLTFVNGEGPDRYVLERKPAGIEEHHDQSTGHPVS